MILSFKIKSRIEMSGLGEDSESGAVEMEVEEEGVVGWSFGEAGVS